MTALKYISKANPFDIVLIKEDDSYVIIGDNVPSDKDLASMLNWDDVEGWVIEDV